MTSPPGDLPAALVVDANVLLSAVIGGRALDVLRHPHAPNCWTTREVLDEVHEYVPSLGAKRGLNVPRLIEELQLLPLVVASPEQYLPFEQEARNRMAARDPDDWPAVALALALDVPIWSQDRDLQESGVAVYTTGRLLDALK